MTESRERSSWTRGELNRCDWSIGSFQKYALLSSLSSRVSPFERWVMRRLYYVYLTEVREWTLRNFTSKKKLYKKWNHEIRLRLGQAGVVRLTLHTQTPQLVIRVYWQMLQICSYRGVGPKQMRKVRSGSLGTYFPHRSIRRQFHSPSDSDQRRESVPP